MSARRMPCKRCHHPKPVGPDGYCTSCAQILAQMKRPKSVPPETETSDTDVGRMLTTEEIRRGIAEANEMDAPGGPRCACGKPSVFEDGSCSDCAVEDARRVVEPSPSPPAAVGDSKATVEGDIGSAGGESDPITERSSKTPTSPPVGASDAPPPIPGFAPTTADSETVTYVANNGDPDLAVLVSAPVPPSPLLGGANVTVASVKVSQDGEESKIEAPPS